MKLPRWKNVQWEPFEIWFVRPNDTPILSWLRCVVGGHNAVFDGSDSAGPRGYRVRTFHCARCKRKGTKT